MASLKVCQMVRSVNGDSRVQDVDHKLQ